MNQFVILIFQFVGKIIIHINHPLILRVKCNDLYHKFILDFLHCYLDKSKKIVEKKHKNNLNYINSGIIWIFWWQGYKSMPNIVKCCINSVKRNSNGHKVIFLSKNNIYKYANIPKYIYYKVLNGIISFTHFSDILRFNLLRNYGGLWVDSTMFCTKPLTNEYFSNIYTSGPGGKCINKKHDFISDKWTSFLIGGCQNNPVFIFMDTFFRLYWKYNNRSINYFLMDHALYYVYKNNIGNFYDYVNNKAYNNNPHLHCLMPCLNDVFNIRKFKQMSKDTNMFKLTYKINLNCNCDTVYKKICNKYL